MNHFNELCHRNCDIVYITGFLVVRKFDFRGIKGQLDVKNVNFWTGIAKIGYLMPILTSRTHIWPIFLNCATGFVPLGILEEF